MFVPPPPGQEPPPERRQSERRQLEIHAEIQARLDNGEERREIMKFLLDQGYEPLEANALIKEVKQGHSPQAHAWPIDEAEALRQAGQKNMAIGGLVFVVGVVVTLGTLAAASGPGGGSYVIAWGAIVFGAIQFFRGLVQTQQAPSE